MRTVTVALVALWQSLPLVFGAVTVSPIVQCSQLVDHTGTEFKVCGTHYLKTPSPTRVGGETVFVGPTVYEYTIVQGLDRGVNVNTLAEAARLAAIDNGIVVTVQYETIDNCTVAVDIQDDVTICQGCSPCGNQSFIADCTNVANGRAALCESTAVGNIFFPLNAVALNAEFEARVGERDEPSQAPTPSFAPTMTDSAGASTLSPLSTSPVAAAPTGKKGKMGKRGKLKRTRASRTNRGMVKTKAQKRNGRGGDGRNKGMKRVGGSSVNATNDQA